MRILLTIAIALWCALAQGQSIAIPGASVQWFSKSSSPPAFGAEIQRWSETSSAATTVITLTGGISINSTIVLTAFAQNTLMTISGIIDSRGNTYTVRVTQSGVAGDAMTLAVSTANASTALQVGDTITITWNNPVSTARFGAVDYLTGVTALDTTKTGTGTANPITAPALCAANTVQFGALWLHSGTVTYSGSAWTAIGTSHVFSGITLYYVQHTAVASASQDPAGSISAGTDWAFNWISMK